MYIQPLFGRPLSLFLFLPLAQPVVSLARERTTPCPPTPYPFPCTGHSLSTYTLHFTLPLSVRVSIKYLPFNEYANIIIYAQFRRFYAPRASLDARQFLLQETTVKDIRRRPPRSFRLRLNYANCTICCVLGN